MTDIGRLNTDREIWRGMGGDYYADSIFVTQGGGIGINHGGHVVVQPLSKWFGAVSEIETLRAENERLKVALKPFARAAKYAEVDDDYVIFGRADFSGSDWRQIMLGDLRRAASILASHEGEHRWLTRR